MPMLRKWKQIFITLRSYTPLIFEVGICIASFRASFILLTDRFYFARQEQAYSVMSVIASEWVWGLLALTAALLKTIGIFGFFSKTENQVETVFLLRAMGWTMSAVIWTSMGVSFMVGRTGQIGSSNTLLLGVFCIGMVLAGPVYSEPDNGR